MKNRANDNNGFTLIETVISLGILSIGILALFAMQTLGIRANASASRVTTLASSGSDVIEQNLIPKISTESEYKKIVTSAAPRNLPSDPNNYTVIQTVTADSPVKDTKTIDITITKKLDGKQLTLRFLKSNPNPK